MKYAITFLLVGLCLLLAAGMADLWVGAGLLWLAIDFLVLGAAYVDARPAFLGKRPDGTQSFLPALLLLPLRVLSLLIWHVCRLAIREPAWNRVTDDLFIGRRLLIKEYEKLCRDEGIDDFANYVDLTAEFPEPALVRTARGYVAFPMLDASVPEPDRLQAVVDSLRPGKTYIHCAQGHGRTGLFTLALLLSSGEIATIDQGLALLSRVRPALRLNTAQMKYVREKLASRRGDSAAANPEN